MRIKIRDLKLRTRIITGFIICILPIAIIGVYAIFQLSTIDLVISSANTLNEATKGSQIIIKNSISVATIIVAVSFIFVIFLGLLISGRITDPIKDLLEVIRRRSGGNLSERVKVESRDEIGRLGREFNRMADKLEDYQKGLEEKVKQKTAGLEKTNKYLTGRELKMIELKKKIKELEETKK